MIKAYLFLYNLVQFVGWTGMGGLMVQHYVDTKSHLGMYAKVQYWLEIFQTMALLEVFHAIVGFVRSNPGLTLMQVMSRVFIVWHVHFCPTVHNTVAPLLFLFAWVVTEIVRYSFYTINLFAEVPYILQWCRYTFFIVLYPLGVTGELLSVWFSLDYVREKQLFSVAMPNKANMAFNYYLVLFVIMLNYIPNFPPLYMHMLRQRRKVIGGGDVSDKKKQ